MSRDIVDVLLLIWGTYLVILFIWIILEKRSPQATLGWLLALAWFPVVGWLIYYFFGPHKLKRHTLDRGESKGALTNYRLYMQEQLAQALQMYPELAFDSRTLQHIDEKSYHEIANKVPHIPLPSLLSKEARQISRMIYKSTGLPISIASDYELLHGGSVTFDTIFEEIERAQHTIHLEYYIYRPDYTGTKLRDLLTKKAKQGVKVRLLLDWLGSRKITKEYMADFLAAGGELAFFHKEKIRQIQSLLNMRLHRKIVVCDGQVGFTGGVNIWDKEDIRRVSNANHDLHLKISGPAVYWLAEIFLEDWYYTTYKLPQELSPPILFSDVPADKVQQVQLIASGPDTPDAPIWRAKLMAINAAVNRAWLMTPYFVPDEPAVFSLVTAALRGVDVRILLPLKSDHAVTDLAGRSWFEELMTAGVQIWGYDPNRLIHAKALLVDDCYSFVGTDNFDNRSFRLNFETTVLNYERSCALTLAAQFEKDMENAKLLTLEDLKSLWWQRLPEDIARLAAPLL